MPVSGCLKAGEQLLGAGDVVNLDSGLGVLPSSHHNCVLELNGAGPTANEDFKTQNLLCFCSNYSILSWHGIIYSYCLLCLIRQIKARSGGGRGVGEQLCPSAGGESSHDEKCPIRTPPRHMQVSSHRQRVGLIPITSEGVAFGTRRVAATTHSVG